MSFTLLGILNSQASGGAAIVYRLQTLGGVGDDRGLSVTVDSSGNAYVFGRTDSTGAGDVDFFLAKYDSLATIQWQRTLGGASNDIGYSGIVDSSGNVYIAGYTASTGAGSDDFLLAKYDSSGTLQWQRVLGDSTRNQAYSLAVDSADNLYIAGYTQPSDFKFLLAKYNSSGTLQWQRTLGNADNQLGTSVTVDSANNVYIGGYATDGSASFDFLLAKYNSSGTIQWQRTLGGTGRDDAYSLAVDSANNVYVFGYTGSTGAGSNDFLLAKYNSSGTIQWQRVLGGAANDIGRSVTVDSSGNVYVVGQTSSAGEGGDELLIAKYDSSGTIQWQRVLGAASGDIGYSITVDSSDNLYVCGSTNSTGAGGNDFLLAVLPNDGSLTGTYVLDGVNMVYAVSTLTAATSTLTAATSSLTSATSTLTAATSTLTSASASLTEHRVDL